MDLSVIIVNWNSSIYLEKCLKSIVENTFGISYEIIVVDNASYDGCDQVVKQYSEVATLVQSERNLGFAKANNLGYRRSNGPLLLFLNPDTEILKDALKKMVQTYLSLEKIGGLGCKVLNSDRTIQTSCIQAFPTIMNQLLDTGLLRNLFPKSGLWGMRPLFEACENAIVVEAITGSCLMTHRESFENVGFFTEEYFMYAEDIDLCYKMQKLGYRNYYTSAASIVHHGGGSTNSTENNSFSSVLMRESIKKFFRKYRGDHYCILFVFAMQIASMTRILLIFILYPAALLKWIDRKNLRNSLEKWKSIFLWSIGREAWVKNY